MTPRPGRQSGCVSCRPSDTPWERAWERAWEWLSRPAHYRSVNQLRVAIENRDVASLGGLLDPDVAVVVDSGDPAGAGRRVVLGTDDASALLVHGMGAHNGLTIDVRSVNGQAGIVLTDRGRPAAAIAVDFTAQCITVVWIRLNPHLLRHWNRV
jgi:hypothetical protein